MSCEYIISPVARPHAIVFTSLDLAAIATELAALGRSNHTVDASTGMGYRRPLRDEEVGRLAVLVDQGAGLA